MHQAKEPASVGELTINDLVQRVKPSSNADTLSIVGRWPAELRNQYLSGPEWGRSHAKEGEAESFSSIIGLDLKLLYPNKIATNLIWADMSLLNF